jgi:hypothetical protein
VPETRASSPPYDALVADLLVLGRTAPVTAPGPALAARVRDQIVLLPAPDRALTIRLRAGRLRAGVDGRGRAVAALGLALLVGLAAAPPVRAAVADWFGFAGVQVHRGAGPTASSAPAPPPVVGGTLAAARRLVAFEPVLPRALGRPDAVEVSGDHRVLSMTWSGPDGPLRLDQFDGRLDYTFAKSAVGVRFTEVAGDFALWFAAPHEVVWLDRDGAPRTSGARLAGHTLVWEHEGRTTMRLEGDVSLTRAREIADSAR